MNKELFEQLLSQGESSVVDFKQNHYLKINDLQNKGSIASFIKDLLCMVNTVRTAKAYIIIGVKEDSNTFIPIGIAENAHIDDEIYRSKLDTKVSPSPKYDYYKFEYNQKIFSIFEIPLIPYSEVPQPIKALPGLELKTVYIRRGAKNVKAEPSEIKNIYDWLKKLEKIGDKYGSYHSERMDKKIKGKGNEIINNFDEETIYRLFGNEAAEDENIERLKEYYFKNDVYNQIAVDLPVRILVAHKGVGKSALFKIAHYEDESNKRLAIIIKPDEVAKYGRHSNDLIELINNWREGLYSLIIKKVRKYLGVSTKYENSDAEIDYYENILDRLERNLSNEIATGYLSKNEIAERFLENRKLNVYLDDLDRGWKGSKEDVTRLSALLNAVRDLCNENRGVHFKISMRSDVYFLVRTSDESTDKIQSSVVWYSWTNHQILIMLIKRVETFFGREINEAKLLLQDQRHIANLYLEPIIEKRFLGAGKWANVPMHRVLMSLIRQRPRDLVKLLTLAAREAYKGKSKIIRTQHLQKIFNIYSQDRVQDTINEFRTELPDIERLIFGMRPTKKTYETSDSYLYQTHALMQKIRDVMEGGRFRFSTGKEATPKQIAQFLYKINFLTARKKLPDETIDRKYFEQNRYLSSDFADFGYDWEIHMAYRWALQPLTLDDIFAQL